MTGIEYSAEKGGAYLGSHLSSTCIPIPRDSVVQSECEHSPAFHKAEQSAPTRPLPHSQTGIQTVQCIPTFQPPGYTGFAQWPWYLLDYHQGFKFSRSGLLEVRALS